MPQCVSVNGLGYLRVDNNNCDFQLLTPSEYDLMQQQIQDASASPFVLTTSQASQLSVAIIGVWAIGFAFRLLIRLFLSNLNNSKGD